jgi:hypothetical protein
MNADWKQALAASIRSWEARRRFGALTPEVLAGFGDDVLELGVIVFVLEFRLWPVQGLIAVFAKLQAGFSAVYTTWMLDAEVANGGFHQYFWNTGGAYVGLVQDGLRRLGAAEHLRVFEDAVQRAAAQDRPDVGGLPARAQMEAFSESALAGSFDGVDAAWYQLGELSAARVRFIRANPSLLAARLPLRARLRLRLSAPWR